jgi:hypothetical protein
VTPFCRVLQKMHQRGLFTHMPFAFDSNTLLFTLGFSDPCWPSKNWRIGYIDARTQRWQLFETGLPAGTVECSPTAYFDTTRNCFVVCFLASIPDNPVYRLYRLFGTTWDNMTPAQNSGVISYHGFINNLLFVSTKFLANDDIHIRIQHRTGQIKTLVALNQYIHKVSYLAQQPQKLLVSLQKKENPRHAKELLVDTTDYSAHIVCAPRHKLYKTSLLDSFGFYAKKLPRFDERQICVAPHIDLVPTTLHEHLALKRTNDG